MRWAWTFASVALSWGCGDYAFPHVEKVFRDVEPTPPEAQGYYGKMTVYDDTADNGAWAGDNWVCAGEPSTATKGASRSDLHCVETDWAGNYTLPLPRGWWRVCVGELHRAHVYRCDECAFLISQNEKIRRDHAAGQPPWWSGTKCTDRYRDSD